MQQTIVPWYRPMAILLLHCTNARLCAAQLSAVDRPTGTEACRAAFGRGASCANVDAAPQRLRTGCSSTSFAWLFTGACSVRVAQHSLRSACAALLSITTSAHRLAEHVKTSYSCGEQREVHIVDELSRAAAHDSGVRCHGCRIFVVTYLRLALLVTSPL